MTQALVDEVPPTEEATIPELLRATKTSDVNKLGRALARVATKPDFESLMLRAIGAAAVNQAVKSVVVANSLLATRGVHLIMSPRFETVDGDRANEISALTFRIRLEEFG